MLYEEHVSEAHAKRHYQALVDEGAKERMIGETMSQKAKAARRPARGSKLGSAIAWALSVAFSLRGLDGRTGGV